MAVGKVAPEAWWDYHVLVRSGLLLSVIPRNIISLFPRQLMQRQEEFFDRAVADLTPTQIRAKLVALAGEVPSIDKSKLPTIQDLLTYKSSPNGGIAVTDDVKWFGGLLLAHSLAWCLSFSLSNAINTVENFPSDADLPFVHLICSQTGPPEWDACQPYCCVGWSQERFRWLCLGREGVVRIHLSQRQSLKSKYHVSVSCQQQNDQTRPPGQL